MCCAVPCHAVDCNGTQCSRLHQDMCCIWAGCELIILDTPMASLHHISPCLPVKPERVSRGPHQRSLHMTDNAAECNVCRCLPVSAPCVWVCREGATPARVQDSVYQYNHQCGTLHLPFSNPGSSPVALAEITAHNRRFPQLTQVGLG